MPQMHYDFDLSQWDWLQAAAVKYKEVLNNLTELKLLDIDNIEIQISSLRDSTKILCILIMEIKAKDRTLVFVALEKS